MACHFVLQKSNYRSKSKLTYQYIIVSLIFEPSVLNPYRIINQGYPATSQFKKYLSLTWKTSAESIAADESGNL